MKFKHDFFEGKFSVKTCTLFNFDENIYIFRSIQRTPKNICNDLTFWTINYLRYYLLIFIKVKFGQWKFTNKCFWFKTSFLH